MEEGKHKAWEWFKKWNKKPAQPKTTNTTLPLNFARYLFCETQLAAWQTIAKTQKTRLS
jgi:hypothetical protein